MRAHQVLIWNVIRNLAQAVHVVGEREQPGFNPGIQNLESPADHGGADHFAERADMRQARRAITGLEQHISFIRNSAFEAFIPQGTRLNELPGIAVTG